MDEMTVGADQVGRARPAEPGGGQHDAIEPLKVEDARDDADALPVAIEERRGDRDRGGARQRGPGDGLTYVPELPRLNHVCEA